jgi:two-component system response regulator AtoC
VPLLIEVFRAKYARSFELDNVHFADDLLRALAERSWPGNVRELENAVVRLLALAEPGQVLTAQSLQQLPAADEPPAQVESPSGAGQGLRAQVLAFERSVLKRTLDATGQNQSEAARRLGISRMTLIEKLKRSGLKD